ncbi:MAG: phosphatidate cytidylyltransferase [Candidatus Omnitrophica bacterium]|nr:phosphatidate cytidylyltransferase [Candidatus Omnitrophota bacterium]
MIIKKDREGLGEYNNILKRIFSSFILIAIVSFVINSSHLSGLFICILIVLGIHEFLLMAERGGIEVYRYFGIFIGAVIPFSIFFQFELNISWQLFLIVLTVIFLIVMQLRRRHSKGVISSISTTIFAILYISWFLSFLIRIRYMPGGRNLLLFLILVVKMGDIGAYFIGSRFGKTPLLPLISPYKSTQGMWGGLFFSMATALVFKPLMNFSYLHLAFLGIFLGILGQLGDLSESLMKRDCNVKDSGDILPGIGGVLDLMDSFLFTAPVFYFYMNIIIR